MIDFRYHVVSLVSVFLALAVGLVLGAGPLQNDLGKQLNRQVDLLRTEKDQLHALLATANKGSSDRDAFVTALSGRLVGGELTGSSVVLVRLPGAEADDATVVGEQIRAAGGTVTGRVDVKSDWTDPSKSAAREQAITDLRAAENSSVAVVPTGSADVVLPQLLTRAVVTGSATLAAQPDPTGQALLSGLRQANLVSLSGGVTRRATEAVVLAPAVETATVAGAAATPTSTEDVQAADAWTRLITELDIGGTGSVVVGPASSATKGGLVASVRGDSAMAKAISTVDDGGTPMGAVTTVFALREQRLGGVGSYGFGGGSQGPIPTPTPSS